MQIHKQFPFQKPQPPVIQSPNLERFDKDLDVKSRLLVTDKETFQQRGQRFKVNSVVSGAPTTTIAQLTDYLIAIDDLAVARGVQLPPASQAGKGKPFVVADSIGGASSTTITISAHDGETIDGSASTTISTNYGAVQLYSNGREWYTSAEKAGGTAIQYASGTGDPGTASGTDVIVCGFQPAHIHFQAYSHVSSTDYGFLTFHYVNGAISAVSFFHDGANDTVATTARLNGVNAGSYMTFSITSVTSTGFTISWTETGTFTSSARYVWVANS